MSASAIHAIISNPQYRDYLAILKGARNGFVYGVKVRFPHALIMAILFGRGEYVLFSGVGNPCSSYYFRFYSILTLRR